MAETKSFQSFRGECAWLNVGMQVSDCALKEVNKKLVRQCRTDRTVSVADVLGVDVLAYPNLNHQAGSYKSVIGQTRNKQTEFAINYLYVLWTNYFKGILQEIIEKNSSNIRMLSGISSAIDVGGIRLGDLVGLNDTITIRKTIVKHTLEYFTTFESTRFLMLRIIQYTGIRINQTIINDAFYYMDIRNLFVHNKHRVSKEFYEKYRTTHHGLRPGMELIRSYQLYQKSYDAIYQLCEAVDKALLSARFVNRIH